VKAIVCKTFGPPEGLVFEDVPPRPVGKNEVRIAVKAAGVNFPDTLIIQGKYQLKAEPPFTPGAEVAGTVLEAGEKVKNVIAGDAAVALVPTGGYAEEVVAPAEMVMPLPRGMDFKDAAGFPMIYGTSYHALKQRAQLKAGETLLVLGAAGGVGLAALQLGKLMGARVIACASSDEKLAFARRHGADEVVNYSRDNLRDALRTVTSGEGVDVVYDPVGGPYAEPALRALGWGGRFLVIGFAAGEIPKIPLNLTLLKSCDVRGVFWGAWTAREPEAHRANVRQLVAWAADGKLSAHVHAVYPLAETAAALEAIANRQVMGKVILRP